MALPSVGYMIYSVSLGLSLPAYGWLLTLHRLLGFLTLIIGILFVTNQWKWKGKKYMDLGILFWTGTILLGIAVYLLLFGIISP